MLGFFAAAAAVLFTAAPSGATGGPATIRAATATDIAPRMSFHGESWVVRAFQPSTRRMAVVRFNRKAGNFGASAAVYNGKNLEVADEHVQQPLRRVPTKRPGLAFENAGLVQTVDGWRVSIVSPTVQVDLRVTATRPGVAASVWTFPSDPHYGRQPVGWSTPVASGTATGAIRFPVTDERADIKGWRVTVEHVWSNLEFGSNTWEYWDNAIVFDGRSTWLLFGMAPAATAGSTAHERGGRTWRGVLARVGPSGTTWCRPKVARRDFARALDAFTWLHPSGLDATCASLSLRLRGRPGIFSRTYPGAYISTGHIDRVGGGSGAHVQHARKH